MSRTITTAHLLSVPFTNDYKHTLFFNNEADQREYFTHLIRDSAQDLSYQRKDSILRYPAHYDDICGYNYVMYEQNGKMFYAFIANMQYEHDNLTKITIETDVMQTWMFDYTVLKSFVEREHVASDIIGEHILDENLQIGEYISNLHQSVFGSSFKIVVGLTKIFLDNDFEMSTATMYNNLVSGMTYRAFDYDPNGLKQLNALLKFYDDEGVGDDVQCMFLAPSSLVPSGTAPDNLGDKDTFGGWISTRSTLYTDTINFEIDGTDHHTIVGMNTRKLDGYEPRNKKLLTFPFKYLMVSNNNGASTVYHFEQFKSEGMFSVNPTFMIEGVLCPGCSVRLIPYNYKGIFRNDEEGLNLGKFPSLSWNSDFYTNWMTQNSLNIGVDVGSAAVSIIGGIAAAAAAPATGGASMAIVAAGAASAAGGVGAIGKTMGEIQKASLTAAQSKGNTNNGDVITVSGQNEFHFYDMSIKKEFAQILDEYFDMFGYKVNTLKVPNKNHRTRWWYTKTIDVNIIGDVPLNDMLKIKNCYNNGITFWRSTTTVGGYDGTNYIKE